MISILLPLRWEPMLSQSALCSAPPLGAHLSLQPHDRTSSLPAAAPPHPHRLERRRRDTQRGRCAGENGEGARSKIAQLEETLSNTQARAQVGSREPRLPGPFKSGERQRSRCAPPPKE